MEIKYDLAGISAMPDAYTKRRVGGSEGHRADVDLYVANKVGAVNKP